MTATWRANAASPSRQSSSAQAAADDLVPVLEVEREDELSAGHGAQRYRHADSSRRAPRLDGARRAAARTPAAEARSTCRARARDRDVEPFRIDVLDRRAQHVRERRGGPRRRRRGRAARGAAPPVAARRPRSAPRRRCARASRRARSTICTGGPQSSQKTTSGSASAPAAIASPAASPAVIT